MAIAFRSAGVSPGAQTTTCVIVKPVGLTLGDLMIAHCFVRGEYTLSSAPTGFTEIRTDTQGVVASSLLYWKIAVQADVDATDFTFTFGAAEYNLGAIAAFTGADDVSPINANNGDAPLGQTAAPTSPEITPTVANCMICLFCCGTKLSTYSGYAIVTSDPASWAEAYDFSETIVAVEESMAMGYGARPETSATGNGTATSSFLQYWTAQLVAIAPVGEPVAGGGGAPLIGLINAGVI